MIKNNRFFYVFFLISLFFKVHGSSVVKTLETKSEIKEKFNLFPLLKNFCVNHKNIIIGGGASLTAVILYYLLWGKKNINEDNKRVIIQKKDMDNFDKSQEIRQGDEKAEKNNSIILCNNKLFEEKTYQDIDRRLVHNQKILALYLKKVIKYHINKHFYNIVLRTPLLEYQKYLWVLLFQSHRIRWNDISPFFLFNFNQWLSEQNIKKTSNIRRNISYYLQSYFQAIQKGLDNVKTISKKDLSVIISAIKRGFIVNDQERAIMKLYVTQEIVEQLVLLDKELITENNKYAVVKFFVEHDIIFLNWVSIFEKALESKNFDLAQYVFDKKLNHFFSDKGLNIEQVDKISKMIFNKINQAFQENNEVMLNKLNSVFTCILDAFLNIKIYFFEKEKHGFEIHEEPAHRSVLEDLYIDFMFFEACAACCFKQQGDRFSLKTVQYISDSSRLIVFEYFLGLLIENKDNDFYEIFNELCCNILQHAEYVKSLFLKINQNLDQIINVPSLLECVLKLMEKYTPQSIPDFLQNKAVFKLKGYEKIGIFEPVWQGGKIINNNDRVHEKPEYGFLQKYINQLLFEVSEGTYIYFKYVGEENYDIVCISKDNSGAIGNLRKIKNKPTVELLIKEGSENFYDKLLGKVIEFFLGVHDLATQIEVDCIGKDAPYINAIIRCGFTKEGYETVYSKKIYLQQKKNGNKRIRRNYNYIDQFFWEKIPTKMSPFIFKYIIKPNLIHNRMNMVDYGRYCEIRQKSKGYIYTPKPRLFPFFESRNKLLDTGFFAAKDFIFYSEKNNSIYFHRVTEQLLSNSSHNLIIEKTDDSVIPFEDTSFYQEYFPDIKVVTIKEKNEIQKILTIDNSKRLVRRD